MKQWLLCLGTSLAAFGVYCLKRARNTKGLPPGPKPWPLLGNIGDFPPPGTPEHEHWSRHKDLYGPISSVTVAGATLILVHDARVAHELLDKNARRTSGRPEMVMANKLCGFEFIAVCLTCDGPIFRRYRRLMHQELGTKTSSARFQDVQEAEVGRQLLRVLKDPRRLDDHYDATSTSMILRMTYGYNIQPDQPDTLVSLVKQTLLDFSLAASPMFWAVDLIPALQYLPDNFPGASFKQSARKWRKNSQASAYVPYNFVRSQMASRPGTRPSSYVSKLVETLSSSPSVSSERSNDKINSDKDNRSGKEILDREDEHAIIWTAASLFGAGSDTSAMTMRIFTFAMIKFPHVQSRAQAEIDRVVGSSRLPGFQDREELPYVNALLKETLRWWPVAAMGFPHTVTEGFEYKDYWMPKGAVILPNVFCMLRDPAVYARPHEFEPKRFLESRLEPDPRDEAFGFGRRVCPGRFFAEASLYLNMAQMLAVFRMSRVLGSDGHEVGVEALDHVSIKPGVLAHPTDFECRVMPRSEQHVQLIRELERRFPFAPGDAGKLALLDDAKPGHFV
ncbi:cytochrome P450 [Microdochium trichocladiopsis]|uniref:Cytochrome P450 n=1 Tax=Microdochium trichocladiopsis TaxID=1682393 RepID=A0A9P8XS07_9PEZI|nr:cytochrome P450 [Microdochium trichocladiopsis]KAH7014349.1 cytochrome P450 [Microdochium trichocladiopsis]